MFEQTNNLTIHWLLDKDLESRTRGPSSSFHMELLPNAFNTTPIPTQMWMRVEEASL